VKERELLRKNHQKFQKLRLVQIDTIWNGYIITKMEELQNNSSSMKKTPFTKHMGIAYNNFISYLKVRFNRENQ